MKIWNEKVIRSGSFFYAFLRILRDKDVRIGRESFVATSKRKTHEELCSIRLLGLPSRNSTLYCFSLHHRCAEAYQPISCSNCIAKDSGDNQYMHKMIVTNLYAGTLEFGDAI